jgi:hypothetical protein
MIRILLSCVFSLGFLTAQSQISLSKADSLESDYFFYHWQGKSKISLTRYGTLERQFPRVILESVLFKRDSGLLILTGFTNMTGQKEDTVTVIGGLPILLAHRDIAAFLSNVRQVGKTEDNSFGKKEGRFILRIRVSRNDVLLIGEPGNYYWGAVIVPVGKFLQ